MKPILFRCPKTGELVQHLVRVDDATDSVAPAYDPVHCLACRQVHFINREGKLLGEKK